MIYVFDSSFAGALIIPDEKNQKVDRVYAGIGEQEEIFVPQLFWHEIASIFKKLIRRRRYTFNDVLHFFPQLAAIRLTGDSETGPAYPRKLLRLCNDYSISSYDAAYLELAGRKKAVLCTLDDHLRSAAQKYGVALLK